MRSDKDTLKLQSLSKVPHYNLSSKKAVKQPFFWKKGKKEVKREARREERKEKKKEGERKKKEREKERE